MVFNHNAESEIKFDDIAHILPSKESISIKVRVLRMWKIPAFLNPSNPSSIEMVLIDGKVRFVNSFKFCVSSLGV
jgi:hypothetical protein